ncbi:MAG: hypothetical protein AAFQ13_11100 [Pseudomonadota bacterium]
MALALFTEPIFLLHKVIDPALDPRQLDADLAVGNTVPFLDAPLAAGDRFRADIESALADL